MLIEHVDYEEFRRREYTEPGLLIKPVVYEEFLSWYFLEILKIFSKNDQTIFFKLARVENLKT